MSLYKELNMKLCQVIISSNLVLYIRICPVFFSVCVFLPGWLIGFGNSLDSLINMALPTFTAIYLYLAFFSLHCPYLVIFSLNFPDLTI